MNKIILRPKKGFIINEHSLYSVQFPTFTYPTSTNFSHKLLELKVSFHFIRSISSILNCLLFFRSSYLKTEKANFLFSERVI